MFTCKCSAPRIALVCILITRAQSLECAHKHGARARAHTHTHTHTHTIAPGGGVTSSDVLQAMDNHGTNVWVVAAPGVGSFASEVADGLGFELDEVC